MTMRVPTTTLFLAFAVSLLLLTPPRAKAAEGDALFNVLAQPTEDGSGMRIDLQLGGRLSRALRLYSEPSHTLLVVVIDEGFLRSEEGRAWVGTIGRERARIVVSLDSPDGGRPARYASVVVPGGRPESDTSIAGWVHSKFWSSEAGGADRRVVTARTSGPLFGFGYATSGQEGELIVTPAPPVRPSEPCAGVSRTNARGNEELLAVRLRAEDAGEFLKLSIKPGPLATYGVRVFSEPSHTLLAAMIDENFGKSERGRAWREEATAAARATIVSNIMGVAVKEHADAAGARVLVRKPPSTDTDVAVFVLSNNWPGSTNNNEHEAARLTVGPEYAFSVMVDTVTAQRTVCCDTATCYVCSDCIVPGVTKCCGTLTTHGSVCCAVFCGQADCSTCQ